MHEQLRPLNVMVTAVAAERCAGPGAPEFRLDRPLGRAQPQQGEQLQLRVPIPAEARETRLVEPAHREGPPAVEKPVPVHLAIELVDQPGDLGVVEVLARRDGAGEKQPGVDGRDLALPRARPGIHLHEVVEEAVLAPSLGGEEAQQGLHAPHCRRALHPAPLGAHRPGAEGETGRRDAGLAFGRRAVGPRPVAHQTSTGIRLLREIAKGRHLQLVEKRIIGSRQLHHRPRPRPFAGPALHHRFFARRFRPPSPACKQEDERAQKEPTW